MSRNSGGTGNHNVPTTNFNPNRYKGMVKVLPTLPHTTNTASSAQRPKSASAAAFFSDFNPTAQNISQTKAGFGTSTNTTMTVTGRPSSGPVAPLLPPPPKSPRPRSAGMGRLDKNINFHQSAQDLTAMQSQFNDKRRLHASTYDLRNAGTGNFPVKFNDQEFHQQPIASLLQNNAYTMNQAATKETLVPVVPSTNTQTRQPLPVLPARNPVTPTTPKQAAPSFSRQNSNDMTYLHDELTQLRREIAAMKDPMQEHEEWLQSQSAQVRELEELQKEFLRYNTENDNQKPLSNPFAKALPVKPVASSTTTPTVEAPPKPKLTHVATLPSNYSRPPITSPKPKGIVSRNESIKKLPNEIQKTTIPPDLVNRDITPSASKASSTSNLRVKRISQIFENNPVIQTDGIPKKQDSSPSHLNLQNRTVRKVSPNILQTIQQTLEAGAPDKPLPAQSKSPKPVTKLKPNFDGATSPATKPVTILETTASNISRPLVKSSNVLTKNAEVSSQPMLSSVSEYSKELLKSTIPTPPNFASTTKSPSIQSTPVTNERPTLPVVPPAAAKPLLTLNSSSKPLLQSNENHQPLNIPVTKLGTAPEAPPASAKPKVQLNTENSIIPESERSHPTNDDIVEAHNPDFDSSTIHHRYENIPSEQEEETREFINDDSLPNFPSKIVPEEHEHRYANIPTDQDFHQDKYKSTLPETRKHTTQLQSNQSHGPLQRPSTAPPPPPQQKSLPVKNMMESEPDSTSLSPPPPPPQPLEVSNAAPITNSPKDTTPKLSHKRSISGSSGTSSFSFSSLNGMPLSPNEVSSKADLMDQIRQFRQSGRILRRATSEMGDSINGTPTLTRKNSMEDALQTRFKAFCGHESDSSQSSEHEEPDSDDWDD